METTAYLMALLETNHKSNKVGVKFFCITSDKYPTCMLQTQHYSIIDVAHGDDYGKARELLVQTVQQKVKYSSSNSLWHKILKDIGEE